MTCWQLHASAYMAGQLGQMLGTPAGANAIFPLLQDAEFPGTLPPLSSRQQTDDQPASGLNAALDAGELPVYAAGAQDELPAAKPLARQRGTTHAQLRQQEAWGSLAGRAAVPGARSCPACLEIMSLPCACQRLPVHPMPPHCRRQPGGDAQAAATAAAAASAACSWGLRCTAAASWAR